VRSDVSATGGVFPADSVSISGISSFFLFLFPSLFFFTLGEGVSPFLFPFPLPPSLDKGLKLAGIVVMEMRFGPSGRVACARVKSGHPIAVSPAMEAVRKWTFKPVVSNGVAKAGCGRMTIKYRLRDQGSSTKLR